MSFGIEVFNENGDPVFQVGRRYCVIVGNFTVPSANLVDESGLSYSFQLPSNVPSNEDLFVMGYFLNPPASCWISGRTVNLVRQGSFVRWNENTGSIYNAISCKVFFGYYA